MTMQWGGGPRSRAARRAMGAANTRTWGEPTRLRTAARTSGPNSDDPRLEAILSNEAIPSRGARHDPPSRRSRRTSEWSPARWFVRIASSGLVGANPAEENGTVVVRPNL